MRTAAAPFTAPEDIPPLEAILTSLRIWLLDLLAALLDVFPANARTFPLTRALARELRARLRSAEYDAKRALFLLALARIAPPTDQPARRHPPPGYAVRRLHISALRFVTHGTFNRRPLNLRLRIDRLRDMLDHPERWIARLLKRLRRGFDGAHAILAAPPTGRSSPRPTHTPAPADSS